MTDNLEGYFADSAYPAQLAERMTPGWLAAATLRNGWQAPETDGPFRMLDIGCGDGLGLAMVAASHPDAMFEGIDGMAAHIDRGRAFTADLPNIDLKHQLFDEAWAAGGYDCDFITAHGVIAWVQPWIRAQALDLVASRLSSGGVAAISYNAMPGWSGRLAYQHLIYQMSHDKDGDGLARYRAAHARARALAEAKFTALRMDEIDLIEEAAAHVPPDYFPHEYINSGWEPLWSAHIRAEMAARGLRYLGQAEFERQRPDLSLTAAQREAMADVTDPEEWDSLFDLAVNTPFRIDLYGRALADAGPEEVDQIWLMARKDADAKLIARTPAGSLKFDNPAARGILEALQAGPKPMSMLAEELGFGMPDIRNAADCLLMGRQVKPCGPPCPTGAAEALNRRLAAAARSPTGAEISALAGAHGPIKAELTHMGLLDISAEDLIAGCKTDPLLKDRFFQESTDLNDVSVLAETQAARENVLARLRRSGVPVPGV